MRGVTVVVRVGVFIANFGVHGFFFVLIMGFFFFSIAGTFF